MNSAYLNSSECLSVNLKTNLLKQASNPTSANFKMIDNSNVQHFLASQYQPNTFFQHSMQQSQHELNQLALSTTSDYQLQQNLIKIDLLDKELWNRFYNLTNEMILTRAGRRTFPLIKLRLSGLDDTSLYTIQIEFRLSDNYKYRFVNGEWRTSPRNESLKQTIQPILYEHTDSPNFGHHWNKEAIAFGKLKLTNNENSKSSDSVFLRSLNKYDPVIHVYRHDKKNVDDKHLAFSKLFKETQFIAVTAYQNEQITNLKIKHNPFAKAFLNNKPTITIDNDNVITIPATKLENRDLTKSDSSNKRESVEKIHPFVLPSPSSDLMLQNSLLSVKNMCANQDLIQNWYSSYYPIPPHHHHQNSKLPIGSNNQSANDGMSYTANAYFNPYNNPSSDYSQYQVNPPTHYSQQHLLNGHAQHQSQFAYTNYSDQITNQQQLYQGSAQYEYNPLTDCEANDRTKQSSPIYDIYPKSNGQSGKRLTMQSSNLKDNRMAPYSTSRPVKPRNTQANNSNNSDSLSASPVYSVCSNKVSSQQPPKGDYNQESDDSDWAIGQSDSLNLTENILNQINNQTQNSSASSFTLSSSASSS